MNNIVEIRFFQCTCSKCKQTVENKRGWADLQENGWKQIGKMLLCPKCYAPYENLDPQIGDTVCCLVRRDSYRQVQYMKTYQVCERIKEEPGAIYVDLCDGWQARLDRGEYEMVE